LPITGKHVVDVLVTEKAVFKRKDGIMVLTDIASEYTLEEIRECTGFKFETVPVD
jgi:3-oxoacid CoA-transferase